MNLGDLIARLEAADPGQTLRHGFNNPHSYRGQYMDLAFELASHITVAAMLAAARSALGATFQGWKGGDFTMDEDSWCWLSQEGDASGETISALLLDFMLTPDRAAVLDEAVAAAVAVNSRYPYGCSGETVITELRRLADDTGEASRG
ncbi:hypothetical protein C9F11_38050 [Streptomyces sp. YIM 121038]|uniref:hypothetical protein n=1 Tax=Streptomyces sp. YIM 121038 TaxID=2136401 RepID=UPI0011100CC4|nr:hypothetical protein [Streptomyces sp. YIM 121038]QCX81193.1 hypothetical protein C9F11_38050 [Streptomyces sp. YIM 121038]